MPHWPGRPIPACDRRLVVQANDRRRDHPPLVARPAFNVRAAPVSRANRKLFYEAAPGRIRNTWISGDAVPKSASWKLKRQETAMVLPAREGGRAMRLRVIPTA